MSYRELRNIAEMLRALGYPRLVSVENFRTPNFPLVAEVLAWVVRRFDPKADDLPTDVDTEQDRVIFIRMVAQFMATKAYVRLNTKKLYQADGFAVQEILKALSLLYTALHNNTTEADLDDEGSSTHNFDMTSRTGELKQIRSLASNITTRGAALFDLLRREVNLREMRTNVMNRPLEVIDVERGLQEAIGACEAELRETQKAIENVATDEATVEAKCEKKKMALERNQKRLQTIKKSRPAFMDEYEKLESQLKIHYNTFVQRFMSLSFLEQRLEDIERSDLNQMSQREAINKRVLDMKSHGGLDLFADDSDDDSGGDGDDDDDDDDVDDEYERPVNAFTVDQTQDKKAKGGRVFGSMTGDVDLDSLSDTELNLNESPDGVRPPLVGVESEDFDEDFGGGVEALLEEEGGVKGGISSRGVRKPAVVSQLDDDDNDF